MRASRARIGGTTRHYWTNATMIPLGIRPVKRLQAYPLQRVPKLAPALRAPFTRPLVQKPKARVLILARDTVIAALLGLLVEMDGFDPVYPAPDETAEQALGRLRAPLVVCADCDIPDVESDLFFARILRSSARLVLFGAPGSEEKLRAMAEHRAVQYFTLPTDRQTLARVLDEAFERRSSSPSRDR